MRIKDSWPSQRGNVSRSNLQFLNAVLYVAEQGRMLREAPLPMREGHRRAVRVHPYQNANTATGMATPSHKAERAKSDEPLARPVICTSEIVSVAQR